jgi:hypothetical protein
MRAQAPATGLAALVCALALCVSCSSSSGGGTAGQAKDAGDGGSTSKTTRKDAGTDSRVRTGVDAGTDAGVDAADEADAAAPCTQCTGTAPSGMLCVISTDVQLVDTTGAGVAGQDLTVCGLNLCGMPVTSDAQGKAHFNLCEYMKSPALKYLGHTSYVSFAALVTQSTETFPPITLFPLPSQGMSFPSGPGSVTSGSVTLALAAGADGGSSVSFDTTQPNDPNSLEFRAAAVDPTKAPPGLDASLGIKALWGLAPANATLSPAATLTIPNPDPTDWPAGTRVDFVMNSMDENPKPAVPYGTWGPVGTGTVSQDGTTITTDSDAGDGLPLTGIVGVGPHG